MRNWLLSCAILLAVTLALRLGLAKRLGPTLRYAIWLPVLIRLLLPVGIGAAGWSVANWGLETEPTQSTSIIQNEPQATPDLSGADIAFTPDHFTGETTPGTPGLLPTLWVVGAILVGGWFLYVEFALALRLRKTRERVEGTGSFLPVYVTDAIPSPCLFGLIRPAIYLTPDVADDEETLRHVLAHEETHFRHGDLIWSLLRGVCLAVHWFDPLVWWAAILSRRDSETACDAGAIQRLGEQQRAAYGRTLLAMICPTGPKFFFNTATLTGSRPEIKERIMLIVSRPKTTLAAVLTVALIGGVAVGCTYPGAETAQQEASAVSFPQDESITAMTEDELAALPDEVLAYAKEYVARRVASYQGEWEAKGLTCTVEDAHIHHLTLVNSGTARENDGMAMYEVYDHLKISDLPGTEDDTGQLLRMMPELENGDPDWFQDNDSRGTAYLLFYWKDEGSQRTWEPITVCYDKDLQCVPSLAQYDNPYTAFIMEYYGDWMNGHGTHHGYDRPYSHHGEVSCPDPSDVVE